MAGPPPNWQATFQQGLRGISTRFQSGAMQFQQTIQQGFNGAQMGFQSAANRASMAVRGYSQRFNAFGGPSQNTGFSQMSSSNPQFGMGQMMNGPPPSMNNLNNNFNNGGFNNNNNGGFNFPEKSPMPNNNYQNQDPARCTWKTLLGLLVIFLILGAAGGGVGVLFTLNDERRNAFLGSVNNGGNNDSNSNATGARVGSFSIDLLFLTDVNSAERLAFEQARARWEEVIVGDLNDEAVYATGDAFCGFRATEDVIIDDLLIVVKIGPIDGPGRILGSAAPCGFDNLNMPRMGLMQFDEVDVAGLVADGQFRDVVLHEMGHVLGLGSLWDLKRLLTPPGTSPVRYLGVNGNLGNSEIGANGDAIVENIGGAGTARGHWKDTTYGNELMTGFLSPGVANPMSRLTVRALADLGYTVDPSKADSFSFSSGRRLRGDPKDRLAYGDDIQQIPMQQMPTREKGNKNASFRMKPLKAT